MAAGSRQYRDGAQRVRWCQQPGGGDLNRPQGKGRERRDIGAIAHHFLGGRLAAPASSARVLVAAWEDDSLSARLGADLADLWCDEGAGRLVLPGPVSRRVRILEAREVQRSLTGFRAAVKPGPETEVEQAGLVLGNLGCPPEHSLGWREDAARSGEAGVLGLASWLDLVWVVAAEPRVCRRAAVHLGRIAMLAGARRITVILMARPRFPRPGQASLVTDHQGLYRTVARVAGASCRVEALERNPQGSWTAGKEEVLAPLLRRALHQG